MLDSWRKVWRTLETIEELDNEICFELKKRLEEAEKEYEQGEVYSDREVWDFLDKKYGLEK